MFIHNKVKHTKHITDAVCRAAGFNAAKGYSDNKEIKNLSYVTPGELTVATTDYARSVLHGGTHFIELKPTNFKLVDTEKNQLIVAWGDEFE